jgi:hypothetical protein
MMKALSALLLSAACIGIAVEDALAAANAEVEGLKLPAWLIRNSERSPLTIGAQLRDRDAVLTGPASRVLLRMADGSTVKLGENAQFKLDGMTQANRGAGLFRASLAVIEGAFRFTTEAVYKFRGRREVDVHFGTVTAGIRGTDLWGKSAPDGDIVCLIEGKITVSHTSGEPVTMQDAQTVLRVSHSAELPPIARVDPDELGKWAAETEIAPRTGSVRKSGKWKVYLFHSENRADAEALSARLRQAGYPTQVTTQIESRHTTHWVYLSGFPDRFEAQALARSLRGRMGIIETSIAL